MFGTVNWISVIGREGEFDGEGGGFGCVTGEDDDSIWGFRILIGNDEM